MNSAARLLCVILVLAFLLPLMPAAAQDSQLEFRCAIGPWLGTNPFTADEASWKVLSLIYEPATERASDGAPIPYIAVGSASQSVSRTIDWGDCMVGDFGHSPEETWQDPAKPEIVIFYDFEGVRWHDGQPMTVRDIMFSFQAHSSAQDDTLGHPLKDQSGKRTGNYSETNWLHIYKAWESQDGSRAALRFVLQKPLYAVFQHYLEMPILPYHIWGTRSTGQFADRTLLWYEPGYNISQPDSWKQWVAERWHNTAPVGSGRFMWHSSDSSGVALIPWEGHFYGPGFRYYNRRDWVPGRPSIDRIVLSHYMSEVIALRDLAASRIDYVSWNVEPSQTAEFANDLNVAARELRSTEMAYMAFNMARPAFGYIQGPGLADLTDAGKPLRRAIAHCAYTGMQYPGSASALAAWENSTAPAHGFDPPEGANILSKSGYALADPTLPPGEDNRWLTSDGAELSALNGNRIEVISPDMGTDRDVHAAASLLAAHMISIGIPTVHTALDGVMLEQRILQRDFDVCVMAHTFTAQELSRPEAFMLARFHSLNIHAGNNFMGYRNVTLDKVLDTAMAEPDFQIEKALVRDAFASLAFDLPMFPLFHRPNVELYRADRFAGFVDDGSGSLLNPWSMANIVRENRQALLARFMNMPLTTIANATLQLRIKATDQNGLPVPGAEIVLHATSGNLSVLGGITDSQGIFLVNYTAPAVPESLKNGTAVMLSIVSASREGYRDAPRRQAQLMAYPEGAMLLFVDAQVLQDVVTARDAYGSAGFTFIDILVLDEKNLPVPDASVMITIEGAAMVPEASSGLTDSEGYMRLRLTAQDVGAAQECTVTITASKVAHVSGSSQVSIMVTPSAEQVLVEQPGGWNPAYLAVPIIMLVCAVYLWRKKSRSR